MEDQFVHRFPGTEVELHPEALKLVDDEGSRLVGTQFGGWLAPRCQRELSIAVLPDNDGPIPWRKVPVQRWRKAGFMQSPAAMRVKTMSLTSGSKGAARRNVSFTVGGK